MRARTRGLRPALAIALVALAAAFAVLATRSGPTSPTAGSTPTGGVAFDGAALPAGTAAPGFTLSEQSGRPVSLASLRGGVTLLAFLSSDCGAPCILIAQQIRGALDQSAHPPAVLLISVDPAADTPARVRRFLGAVALTGRARYLSGPPAALAQVWRAYRIRAPGPAAAVVERSAPVVLIDRDGRERVLYSEEQLTPEALVHDIGRLQGPPNPG